MRQRINIGDICSIPLTNGKFMFIMEGEDADHVIFRLISTSPTTDVKTITDSGILFHTSVYKDLLTSGKWMKVGKIQKDDVMSQYSKPPKFTYDEIGDYFRMGVDLGSKDFSDRRPFEEIYDMECRQVYDEDWIKHILEYYIETGFYHPRTWDISYGDDCITHLRPGKYKLKSDHRAHGLKIRKRYGILEGKIVP